ncbi:hypothetical protein ABPG77_008688, partial [Micractinium sp. CCAP 211/92]
MAWSQKLCRGMKPRMSQKAANGSGDGAGADASKWLEGISHEGLRCVLERVAERDPDQTEFLEAVHEVAASLQKVLEKRPELLDAFALMCEPERQIVFRVPWLDDEGNLRCNRGFRVQ